MKNNRKTTWMFRSIAIALLLLALQANAAINLLSESNLWRGDIGFSVSNNTMFFVPTKKVIACLDNLNIESGKVYKLVVEYEWNGPKAKKPHDFFLDLINQHGWDDSEYNFIPQNTLRRNGKHRYTSVFTAKSVPKVVTLRVLKLTKADILITKLSIEPVSHNYLRIRLLINDFKKWKVPIGLGSWFVLQIVFIIVAVKLLYKPQAGKKYSEILPFKQKKKSMFVFFITCLVIIGTLALCCGLRYKYLLSKNIPMDLMRGKWRSVQFVGENGTQKMVAVTDAPDGLEGFYWIDVAISIPTPSVEKNEEVIVDFYGNDYDPESTKLHIKISNEVRNKLSKKVLLYFNNPPTNLYLIVYSTYNTQIELEKVLLTKRPSWKKVLFFNNN